MDGVVPALAKRVAPQQPFEAHPDTARGPVTLDRLQHVLGAGGDKTAGRRQAGRNPPLVKSEGRGHERAHLIKSLSTSFANSGKGASAAAFRPWITTRQPGPSRPRFMRTASRSRRLTRLRATLPPTLFGTANPTRLGVSPPVFQQTAPKYLPGARQPCSYTNRNSPRLRSRNSLGHPNRGAVSPVNLLGVPNSPLGTDGQLFAPGSPAASQHGPPVLGLHTHPEAVRLGPLPVIRLECTLWHVVWSPLGKRTPLP